MKRLLTIHGARVLRILRRRDGFLGRCCKPGLVRAKREAETRGFVFEIDRDEILARAKKEGKLSALAGLDSANIKAMASAFSSKYPFIDFYVEEITGTDSARRFILDLKRLCRNVILRRSRRISSS